MTATGWACQFRAPSERPESTHCSQFPHDTGSTAVDPNRSLVSGDCESKKFPIYRSRKEASAVRARGQNRVHQKTYPSGRPALRKPARKRS